MWDSAVMQIQFVKKSGPYLGTKAIGITMVGETVVFTDLVSTDLTDTEIHL